MKEIIEGWVARDGEYSTIGIFVSKQPPIYDEADKVWKPNGGVYWELPKNSFIEQTTEMQPRKVKITIETIE